MELALHSPVMTTTNDGKEHINGEHFWHVHVLHVSEAHSVKEHSLCHDMTSIGFTNTLVSVYGHFFNVCQPFSKECMTKSDPSERFPLHHNPYYRSLLSTVVLIRSFRSLDSFYRHWTFSLSSWGFPDESSRGKTYNRGHKSILRRRLRCCMPDNYTDEFAIPKGRVSVLVDIPFPVFSWPFQTFFAMFRILARVLTTSKWVVRVVDAKCPKAGV